MKKMKTAPALALVRAMLIFGTIGIVRRWIPWSSGALASARGLLGALLMALASFARRRRGAKTRIGIKKTLLLALTGALIGANWIFLFEAYRKTSVATATLCYYMAPTLVILFSPLFLSEKLTARRLCCAAVSLIGMTLVSGVTDHASVGENDWAGVLLALCAAALYGAVVILNKKVYIEDVYRKTTVELFCAGAVMLPYVFLFEDWQNLSWNGEAVLLVLLVGVVHTGIAYALYFGSIQKLRAQTVALVSYIDPISALILSATLLREPLTVTGIVGAVLILGATAMSETRFGGKSRDGGDATKKKTGVA